MEPFFIKLMARCQTETAASQNPTLRTTDLNKNKTELVMGMQSSYTSVVTGQTTCCPIWPHKAGCQVKYSALHKSNHLYCQGAQLNHTPAKSKWHQGNDSYQQDPTDVEWGLQSS